jgi:TfoX/Sxy family transcriptional regulator of competence genes
MYCSKDRVKRVNSQPRLAYWGNRPMPHDPKQLQTIFTQAVPPQLEIRFKPMFGGILAYAFDKPCGSLSDAGLALKLSGALREELLAVAGAVPLRYAPDQPLSKTYVVVPDSMLADREILSVWIARTVAGLKTKAKT